MANDINTLQAIVAIDPMADVTLYADGSKKWKTTPISDEDILAKQTELQAEYDALEYQRKRKEEYPPMADYLDAIVKGDETQKQKYIDDCKAVKEKYPK